MATTDYWFSLAPLKSLDAYWSLAFGRRGNGKTTEVLVEGLKVYKATKGKLAIIRRLAEDYKLPKRSKNLCDALYAEDFVEGYPKGVVQTLFPGVYNTVYYRGLSWYLAYEDENGNIIRKDKKPFAVGFSLNTSKSDKSMTNMNFRTILFDEFISESGYLPDEFRTLCNLISTIVRDKAEAKIYMIGNTVNMYCPYFREMGLHRVRDLKPGDIKLYKYANSKLTVAVHYTDAKNDCLDSDVYFYGFNNPKLKMITSGEWEMEQYPHKPCHFRPIDVLYKGYICFDEYWYMYEIVGTADMFFLYISHLDEEPVVEPDELVYSTADSAMPNYRKNILKPLRKVEKQIYSLFRQDKVFYDDNMTGEAIRNYFVWCASH